MAATEEKKSGNRSQLSETSARSTGNYETCVKSRRYRKSSCRQAWPSFTLVASSRYGYSLCSTLRPTSDPSVCFPLCLFVVTDIANNRSTYSTPNSKELTRSRRKRDLPVLSCILVRKKKHSDTCEMLLVKRIWYCFHGKSLSVNATTSKNIEGSSTRRNSIQNTEHLPSLFMGNRCALGSFTKNIFADTLLSPYLYNRRTFTLFSFFRAFFTLYSSLRAKDQ